jgi:ABC-type lipoprotein release transport system permease subunit
MLMQNSKWFTVKDMYDYAKTNNLQLLSDFNAEFWNEYITNSTKYDILFSRLFKSYRYYNQDIYNNQEIETVTKEFIEDVYNHLMINKKKYTELYRIEVLSADENKLLDNFSLNEKMDRTGTDNKDITLGSRIDSSTSTTNFTMGSRNDVTTENATTTQGGRSDITENEISGFNSSSYQDADKTSFTKGEESDSSDVTTNITKGEQNDVSTQTENFNKGQEKNTHVGNTTEHYTLTRSGKTGYTSNSELIKQHIDLWNSYKFYSYIFNEISAELLLV